MHVLCCAAAVAAAGIAANLLHIGHPFWAMVAALVPLASPDLHIQITRGLHRVVGTLIGLIPAAGLLLLDLGPVGLVIALALCQIGIEFTVTRHYATALVFIAPAGMIMGAFASPAPPLQLLTDRTIQTVIGIFIGVSIAILTRRASHGQMN